MKERRIDKDKDSNIMHKIHTTPLKIPSIFVKIKQFTEKKPLKAFKSIKPNTEH